MRLFYLFFLMAACCSCNQFEYSPDQIFDKNSARDLNATNLNKLGDGAHDDTIRFVLTGDHQRSSDESVSFYKKVNTLSGIDFVVVAGDITEFGVLKEMEWVDRELSRLNMPYVALIGNHDLTSRGRASFIRMFGPLNYSFIYGGVKFICHDTNSREYNFNGTAPNISWLKNELKKQEGVEHYVAISHVAPNSPDFDPAEVSPYTTAFAQTTGFLASLHAHAHTYEMFHPDQSGIPYVITSAVINKEFLVVEIVKEKISFERVYF